MRPWLIRIATALFGLLLMAGVASAHVTVWPKQSTVNGYERYTIRVPNEKPVPTTKLRVELPADSIFSAVLPVPGWTFTAEKDAAGKVIALDWAGGEINPGEFFEFGVQIRNPKTAGPTVWKAYQTYSDGTVVQWTGPEGADTPAPVVTLTAAAAPSAAAPAAAAPAPAAGTAAAPTPAPAPVAAVGGRTGVWLGGAALLLSLVALFLAIGKR